MVFHIDVDVLPSSCKECFVKGRHCVWAIRVIYCYIPAVITCQWMPLCSVALSPHVLSLAKYRMRKFTKSQSHLQQIPPISFTLPQLCAHGALKVIKQLSTEVVLSLTLHQIRPALHPPVVPTGRFQGPWPWLFTASTAAPAASSCSTTTTAVGPSRAARCSGVQPQAPKGSETSTAGGTPPHLQWEKLQSVE